MVILHIVLYALSIKTLSYTVVSCVLFIHMSIGKIDSMVYIVNIIEYVDKKLVVILLRDEVFLICSGEYNAVFASVFSASRLVPDHLRHSHVFPCQDQFVNKRMCLLR